MVFIFGTSFDASLLASRALQRFYGISHTTSRTLLSKTFIHPTARVGALTTTQITNLSAELSQMTLENDLRRTVRGNIKRLRDMGTWRGRRHAMGLPVRGQRTKGQIFTAKKLNRVERRG